MVTLLSMPALAEWQVIPSPQAEPQDYNSIAVTPNGTVHIFEDNGGYIRGTVGSFDIRPNMSNYMGDSYNVQFLDDNLGYVAGGSIIKTTDGGDTWIHFTDILDYVIRDIHFWTPDSGIGVGDNGVIIFTGDGGENWTVLTSPTTNDLRSIDISSDGMNGIAVGIYGTMIVSSGDLLTWTIKPTPSETWLYNVKMTNDWQVGVSTGWGGAIRSTNGGDDWLYFEVTNDMNFGALVLSDDGSGLIGGENGNIYNTTNSGFTWHQMNSNTSNKITNFYLLEDNSAWAVGKFGTILYDPSIPVSIEPNDISIPDGFILKQNFPNPFNPSTQIEFSLPIDDFVNITVYNTIGQVVDIATSSYHTTGNYKVEWNGSELPSGIYFYQLRTSTFTKSMKMLLVK